MAMIKERGLDKHFWQKNSQTVIIYAFLILLMIFVSFFSESFFTERNLKNLVLSAFPLLMVALGQTLVILTGGIDLSLGPIVSLTNVLCVALMHTDAEPGWLPAVLAALATGFLCGGLNGLVITQGRLAPIIVTLATTAIYEGGALFIMANPGGSVHAGFRRFMTRGIEGYFPFLLFLLVLVLVRILTNRSVYGKSMRALGGNEGAAYSTGIRVERVKFTAYALAGLLAAIAGIFLAARMNSGDATVGKNFSMNAITATVVGGTAMTGAVGDPLGTVAGVFIITIINNMLNLFGVSSFYQYICQGVILIAALSLSALRRRK